MITAAALLLLLQLLTAATSAVARVEQEYVRRAYPFKT